MVKVLIIEDDPVQARTLKDIIEVHLKYETHIALDGKTGIKETKEIQPDLIILDYELPDIDGFGVCKQIKSFGKIPIFFLTGVKKDPADKIEGYDLGVDAFMIKPYDVREVLSRIKAIILKRYRPFRPTDHICKLYLNCDQGHHLQLSGLGGCTGIIRSSSPLAIDPAPYALEADKNGNVSDWRVPIKRDGIELFKKIIQNDNKIFNSFIAAQGKVKLEYPDHFKICFATPLDFSRLPFEFLFDVTNGEYLVLLHPVSRQLIDINKTRTVLSPTFFNNLWEANEQLRILLIASDTDPPLPNVDDEIFQLEKMIELVLKQKEIPYHIKCIPTKDASLNSVKDILKQGDFHILHFAGHGWYNHKKTDNCHLLFWEKKNREGDLKKLNISSLSLLLRNSNLRFVFFNCCKSAVGATHDNLIENDFTGLAYGIAQAGIPSILGFRWNISDASALQFAKNFYQFLFNLGDVEIALYNARKNMAIENGREDKTWMAPVLFIQE